MKKIFKNLNSTLFDVATAPVLFVYFGIPILITIAVIVIVVIAIKLIIKAYQKNQDIVETDNKEENDQHK